MAASAIDIPATTPGRRLSAGLLTLWLLFSPTGLVFAGPVADAAAIASQRPTVTTSPSGVAMVNITAPNSAGLSYNRYQRFDVDPSGLLLNNSTAPLPTLLGPVIPANDNLGGRSASLIVNEVVTAIPSQLNGPLGVLGDPAKVVIANPNGISCNGCSFLNTPQVQLSTGSIGFRDAGGAASSFDAATGITLQVTGGQIRIDGAGLSSYLARLDLIAETISANGPVTITGALNLLAGRQTVDAESLAVLATGAGNSKAGIGQDWAVDATAFGAMNAGSIRIVATPAGMGVRSAALLAASGGDLAINVNGDLTLANAAASRDVMLSAAGAASNGGQIVAGRNLDLAAASLDNRNQAIAALGGDINLSTSGTMDNVGGVIASSNGLSLSTPSLDNSGGLLQAGGKLSLALPGSSFDLSGTQAGTLAAGGEMAIQASALTNSGSFGHTGALSLTAGTITNTGLLATQGAATLAAGSIVNDGTLAAGTTLDAQAATSLVNTGIWAANGDAALSMANLSNSGTISSNGKLTFAAPTFANSGQVVAAGDLALAAAVSFANSGIVAAGNDAAFTLGSSASNAGGLLTAGNDLTLTTQVSGNFGGTVGANRDLILNFTDYTHGAGETAFLAGRNITLTADSLSNAATLAAYQDLTITTTGGLANTGLLLAGQDAAFNVGGTFSNAGIVETGRDLSISAAALSNGSGASTVQSWGQSTSMADYRAWVLTQIDDPVIQGKLFNEITPDWQWHNSRFYLINRWGYFMDSGLEGPYFSLSITRHNTDASLSAGRNLTASVTGTLANNAALITAGNDLTLTAAVFQNLAAQDRYEGIAFAGGGGHNLVAYANSASTVQAAGNVSIIAPTQTNTGTIQGSSVYLGGALTNGLTDYNQPTPATTLPHAVIDLTWAPTGMGAGALPGATFTPAAPALFSSAAQLSLLAPVGQNYLDSLLPESLRNSSTPFMMDAWLEQQALRQAALRETGQATFLSGLSYDAESGLSIDSQQRALLYQAAARFASAEDIRLGVALSEAQQAKLAEPILWYVEETVTGPDGKSYAALAPKLYLPEGQLDQWANVAGGVIRGQDVTLDAGTGNIENTGYIVAADTLTVDAGELVNRVRSAAWGSFTQDVEGGYLEVWGDRVQPGGFMRAATMEFNTARIESISGVFLEAGLDKTGSLQNTLGAGFSQSQNIDHTFTEFHADSGLDLEQLVILVVGVVVAIYTAGAASGAIASAAGETAAAAATAAGATAAEAAAAGAAAASAATASLSTAMISGAAAGMSSSVATQVLTTGKINGEQLLSSGISGALSSGLTTYYGSTWSAERMLASAAVSGATNMISGGKFEDGFITGLAVAGLTWAASGMRDQMVADSKKFAGICDGNTGECFDNKGGESIGLNNDKIKIGGGRIDLEQLKEFGEVNMGENGKLEFIGSLGDDGTRVSLEYALSQQASPLGGVQGMGGQISFLGIEINYEPGSFWDRVVETYSGPHDMFNSTFAYDAMGNIDGSRSAAQRAIGEIMNYINVPLTTPLAMATTASQYGVQILNIGELANSNYQADDEKPKANNLLPTNGALP